MKAAIPFMPKRLAVVVVNRPLFTQPGSDISGIEQIVKFEKETEAQQDDQLPDGPCGRQPVKPCRDCVRRQGKGRSGDVCPLWNQRQENLRGRFSLLRKAATSQFTLHEYGDGWGNGEET